MEDNTGNLLVRRMEAHRDDSQVPGLSRFFKTGEGQYGEGDKFLGIKVPVTREVVRNTYRELTLEDISEAVRSEYHEIRLAALLCLVKFYGAAGRNPARQKETVDFYLTCTPYINNWDLVDLSCYEILGTWLIDKPRDILYELAQPDRTLWEQRIAIVSTMALVRKGQLDDTYRLAELFIGRPGKLHDLLQKAVGWLLREAGKRDGDRLEAFLREHIAEMPRTALRYAVEKFPEEKRKQLLTAR